MASSFTKIDYRLRPAKSVERRMMAESFLRLRPFGSVESYRYVGMGSVYFSDFSLFRSICGFETLVSIELEDDETVKNRFKFNVPLGDIDLKFGHTNTVLPTLPWDLRTVAWLDYDGFFTKDVLTDIRYLASKLHSGSVLCVSVNADLRDEDQGEEKRLKVLIKRLGSNDKIPAPFSVAGVIRPNEVPDIFRTIMTQELTDGLNDRNVGRPPGSRIAFEQILFFEYRDGAPMLTIGWIVFEEGQRHAYQGCSFSTLPFVRQGSEPFKIALPLLTNAEIREINRCDAAGTFCKLEDLPLPAVEVEKFNSVRRYWPLASLSDLA